MTNEILTATRKATAWPGIKGAMLVSLIVGTFGSASCGPAATAIQPSTQRTTTTSTTAPANVVPSSTTAPGASSKYGGTITIYATDPTNWDPIRSSPSGGVTGSIYQKLWEGDWSKGLAGGYGTGETDWGPADNDLFDLKIGFIAETTKWNVDAEKNQGAIVYKIRRGIHYAVNPDNEASRLLAGRELTADDVLFAFKRATTETFAYIYGSNVELRNADIRKTGPWEITIKLPLSALYTGVSRFGDGILIYPPELITKYGGMTDWQVAVGTGPFMLTDYVQGSSITFVRNLNYWMTDPVGPGKGNRLPYPDGVKMLIIPDLSTQLSAMRTGKVDLISGLALEDAAQLRKTTPGLQEKIATTTYGRGENMAMRIDRAPFSDIRVRRAMMLAVDFKAINQGLYGGAGAIPTFPYSKTAPYEELYLGLDDPAFPASAKELYTYNPDKARQLLAEAGYPNGFKTELLLTTTDVDYYSIIVGYYAKVGIDMKLDIEENGVATSIKNKRTHRALATSQSGPIADFLQKLPFGVNSYNLSMIDDPYINDTMERVRLAAITDQHKAMAMYKDMTRFVVDQAYAIPKVLAPTYRFWWPWVKNYSGEVAVGADDFAWYQWVWSDTSLKRTMGR